MTARGHGAQGMQHTRPRPLPGKDRRLEGDVPGGRIRDRHIPSVHTVKPVHCESLPRSSLSLILWLSRSAYAGGSARRELKVPLPWSGRVWCHCRLLARGHLCGSQLTSRHNHCLGWGEWWIGSHRLSRPWHYEVTSACFCALVPIRKVVNTV